MTSLLVVIETELERQGVDPSRTLPPAAQLRKAGVELAVPLAATVDGRDVVIAATLDRTAIVHHEDGQVVVVLLEQVLVTEPVAWRGHQRSTALAAAGDRGRARAAAAKKARR